MSLVRAVVALLAVLTLATGWAADEKPMLTKVRVHGWKLCGGARTVRCVDPKSLHQVTVYDEDGSITGKADLSQVVPEGLLDANPAVNSVRIRGADGKELWVPDFMLDISRCDAPPAAPATVDTGAAHGPQPIGLASGKGCAQ